MQRLIDFFARRFLVLYFVAAAVLLFGMLRPAQAMTGNELIQKCESQITVEQLSCVMYVSGLMDMGQGAFFCAPQGATYAQSRDILMKAMRDVPVVRNERADIITIQLFSKLWPCKQEEQRPRQAPL